MATKKSRAQLADELLAIYTEYPDATAGVQAKELGISYYDVIKLRQYVRLVRRVDPPRPRRRRHHSPPRPPAPSRDDQSSVRRRHAEMKLLATAFAEALDADPLKGAELLLVEIIPREVASLQALLDAAQEDHAKTAAGPNTRETRQRAQRLIQTQEGVRRLIGMLGRLERRLPPGLTQQDMPEQDRHR